MYVFYHANYEGQASSVAYFSIYVLFTPTMVEWNDRNTP